MSSVPVVKAKDILSKMFNIEGDEEKQEEETVDKIPTSAVEDDVDSLDVSNLKIDDVTNKETEGEKQRETVEIFLYDRGCALGSAAGLTGLKEVKTVIHEIVTSVSTKCNRDTLIECFIHPIIKNAFDRCKITLQENNVVSNAICQEYCFQLAFMFHKYNIHDKIILNLNIYPVTVTKQEDSNETTNANVLEQIEKYKKENVNLVLAMYTLLYKAYHTNTFVKVLSKELDEKLKELVMTHYDEPYRPTDDWRITKNRWVEWYRSLSILFNYSSCFVPWIENGV